MRAAVIELLGGEGAIEGRGGGNHTPSRSTGTRPRPVDQVREDRPSYGRGELPGPVPAFPLTVFRTAALDHLAERLEIAPDVLMALLGITGRTAQRRRQQGLLSADESDRLYRVARVLQRAIEVFGAEDSAIDWLTQRQPFFELHAPLELLGSDAGAQAVEQELGRIDYGDFS